MISLKGNYKSLKEKVIEIIIEKELFFNSFEEIVECVKDDFFKEEDRDRIYDFFIKLAIKDFYVNNMELFINSKDINSFEKFFKRT